MTSNLPATIPAIRLFDPLAQLLGASEDGILEYAYFDCVRLAGHSCPTVAGAYLMTLRALQALYPDELPVRGNLRLEHSGAKDQGTNGVTANVASYITGAADEGGFKGLNGAYARNNRLTFNGRFDGILRFTRLDSGSSVTANYDPSGVAGSVEMPPLMQAIFSNSATDDQRRQFGKLWQARVSRILEREINEGGLVLVEET